MKIFKDGIVNTFHQNGFLEPFFISYSINIPSILHIFHQKNHSPSIITDFPSPENPLPAFPRPPSSSPVFASALSEFVIRICYPSSLSDFICIVIRDHLDQNTPSQIPKQHINHPKYQSLDSYPSSSGSEEDCCRFCLR